MSLIQKSNFMFSQKYFIGNECPGLCAGISMAMLLYLKECHPLDLETQRLETIFYRAKEYADMLRMTYNPIIEQVTPGTFELRNMIYQCQSRYECDYGCPGTFEYYFDSKDIFLINIRVTNNYTECGSQYISAYNFISTSNHAGLLFTDEKNEFFLFDPNAGGGIFSWSRCGKIKNIICAVDAALDILYRQNRHVRGRAFSRLNAAKRLDYNNIRYHHSV